MAAPQSPASADIGLIGLGVMGANLGLNIAEHGFTVSGYDRDPDKGTRFAHAAQEQLPEPERIKAYSDIAPFIAALRRPRAILMLVPAGAAVDAVIETLSPHLDQGDILIDGGNSHFQDTDRRLQALTEQNIHFVGMGVSGGEAGARHGPSLMPGGDPAAWERLRPLLEAAAAKVKGEPCVGWLGQGSAGHYVKMVHNGIEYGLMQLIAESYDLMHRGLGLSQEEMGAIYSHWAQGPMGGFLLEITVDILEQQDPLGEGYLLCKILDSAHQKGTGQWTSQESLALQVPTPLINTAVTQRVLSAAKAQRQQASQQLGGPIELAPIEQETFITHLSHALQGAMQLTYLQGMHLLQAANQHYDYRLCLELVASIWRGGCIIRSQLLEDLRAVYQRTPELINPLLDKDYGAALTHTQEGLRAVVQAAACWGLPVPGLMAALGYYDSYRSSWLPANLLQAQRDYFGAHTFQRTDREGSFHVEWDKK
ncbi:6-phosphogluconate dehydrogenase, decarboxylating [Nitrosococcus halophilus Nc 4]|uniref:6-phosphogluconate dehydrogenase, decarboxylating n=1 Tax=Nitrosococcus halophilus (strain Nc4) TaxID=472759 RepID=D5BY03_NITHN|nr:NADP-dependent phosphogluconate dehydrogenase [Nitrosococcus halophilus]ADE15914.1 6-phosphogluconate dehydrogenase, decarboxylating [Nitrosococcus halophilus Nc 4]